MITFWNRKEVYVGYSMSEFVNKREILISNQIEYIYRTVNSSSGNTRGKRGSFGVRTEFSCMYYLYVHKNDYEWACELIRTHLN